MMREFFKRRSRGCIGVFLQQDTLYYAVVERVEKERLRLCHADSCRLFLEESEEFSPQFPHIRQLAEELAVRCSDDGVMERQVAICVPSDKYISYPKTFPPLEGKELSNAVRWEVEANAPFTTPVHTCHRVDENTYTIRIMDELLLQELCTAFQANGFTVVAVMGESVLLPQDEGNGMCWKGETADLPAFFSWEKMGEEEGALKQAFFAAWQAVGEIPPEENFLPLEKQEGSRDWRKLAAIIILPVLLLGMFLYGKNAWRLRQLEEEKAALEQELRLRAEEQTKQSEFSRRKKNMKTSAAVLKELRNKRMSWYGVFTALGTSDMRGIVIKGIESEPQGLVHVSGIAESYAAITDYMGQWGTAEGILKEPPGLESAETDSAGNLKFTLRMRF